MVRHCLDCPSLSISISVVVLKRLRFTPGGVSLYGCRRQQPFVTPLFAEQQVPAGADARGLQLAVLDRGVQGLRRHAAAPIARGLIGLFPSHGATGCGTCSASCAVRFCARCKANRSTTSASYSLRPALSRRAESEPSRSSWIIRLVDKPSRFATSRGASRVMRFNTPC